jgi:FAD/FMN-containing dehydrogenase
MHTTARTTADELRLRLHGGLHRPGEAEYEDACVLFNSMIESRPRFVASCAAPDDVIAVLAFAREHDIDVAVRAGGHSVTGASLCDDGIVIDVRAMDDVVVDPVRRVARVGGGATWAAVDAATQEHGLATTGGRVSSTGVAGLTMGGGSGWLERKHGLACDNLVAAELVTAAGDLVRASEDENPELLWALRGAGGNFGVVIALEFALHPVGPEVLAGGVFLPGDMAPEAMTLFRDVMAGAPEELGLGLAICTAPDEEFIPAPLRGQPAVLIGGMYAGSVADGEQALAELRAFGPPAADLFAPMPYTAFQSMFDDPPGYRNYWTAEQLPDLLPGAIEAIDERSARMPAGASQVFIVPWGGQIPRATSADSPLSGRDAGFVVHPLFLWEDPKDDDYMFELGRGFRDDLAPYSTGDVYLNFIGDEGDERVRDGFAPGALERLREIKREWDPQNVFHADRRISP